MKRHWIDYAPKWTPRPLSYWVHIETDGQPWFSAHSYDPPRPDPVPGRGYAVFCVEVDGFTFEFASLDELDHCVETLSRKALPTSSELSSQRPGKAGPHHHWLGRLPGSVKSWRYREKAVEYLKKSRTSFGRELERGA